MFTPGYPVDQIVVRGQQGKVYLNPAMTTADYPVGTRSQDEQGREYVYFTVPVSTTIVAGTACLLAPAGAKLAAGNYATPAAAYGGTPVGICMVAITSDASNVQYCWFCVYAPPTAYASCYVQGSGAGFAAGAAGRGLYAPASASSAGVLLLGTAAGQAKIHGLVVMSSHSLAAATVVDACVLNYPYLDLNHST